MASTEETKYERKVHDDTPCDCGESAAAETTAQVNCYLCAELATHIKMNKPLCDYHWDLANDHKRGR